MKNNRILSIFGKKIGPYAPAVIETSVCPFFHTAIVRRFRSIIWIVTLFRHPAWFPCLCIPKNNYMSNFNLFQL